MKTKLTTLIEIKSSINGFKIRVDMVEERSGELEDSFICI